MEEKFKAKVIISNYTLFSVAWEFLLLCVLTSTWPCLVFSFLPVWWVCYKILIYNFLIINGGWAAFHMFTNICLSSSVKSLSRSFMYYSQLSNSLWPHGLYNPWNSPGQNTGVGGLSLLQGIFPTQGSNPGVPHCRLILYHLSHKGSPTTILFGSIFPYWFVHYFFWE